MWLGSRFLILKNIIELCIEVAIATAFVWFAEWGLGFKGGGEGDDSAGLSGFGKIITHMLNYKQLYVHNDFELPEMPGIDLHPFPEHPLTIHRDQPRDHEIDRVFHRPEPLALPNTCSAYSKQFEQLTAKQNVYPFMLATGPSKLCVVCRDCLMICDWGANEAGRLQEGGDELVRMEKWERVKTTETPTAVAVGRCGVYVGWQTGRVSQYVFKTKDWEGSSEQLQLPVMRLQVAAEEESREGSVVALDSAGNLVLLTFSHKTFLDKIIKTLSSAKWISFMFRNKKREKIKKIFKSLLAKKERDNETQAGSSETVDPPIPYSYNTFHLKSINDHYLIAVYRNRALELLVLDQHYALLATIPVEQPGRQEAEPGKEETEQVWLQLGQGGFANANTRHHVLVLGVGTSMQFFRVVEAEEEFEVVKVCEVVVQTPLLYGQFVSNNLLLVGDSHHLYLCTVGQPPQRISSLSEEKFNYIDFFIQEEGLEADRHLLARGVLAVTAEGTYGDRCFVGLQGKRLVVGCVAGWESMLLNMVLESQWEEAMHCFDAVYSGQFQLCCRVNENMAERNKEMLSLCQAISKGYLETNLSLLRVHPGSPQSGLILNNLLYFMLKCDYPELLFSEAEKTLTTPQLTCLFLDELGPYVEQANGYGLKLPFISECYLGLVIGKYRASEQEHVLERLLMQLDLGQMERLLLLGVCLKEELYRSLMAICCGQKDYITPIVKLCGIGLSCPGKRERLAEMIYWYLSECLEGRMTDYGNEGDYLGMLAVLINFMFIPSSLEMLLASDHAHLMEVVYMFFHPKVMRYILENEQRFFMRQDGPEQPLFEENCLSEFKLYEKMLSVLVAVVGSSQQPEREGYELELNRLLITLMLRNHFPFMARFKITIIHFFIRHPLLFVGGKALSQEHEVEVNGQLMRLMDSLVRSICDKCLSLRERLADQSAVTELEELLREEKEKEMNSILQMILLSPFSQQLAETKCYIHHELGHYSTVLELYLRMANRPVRTKVFLYLENNLNEFSKLTQQFLKYLLSLLGIDRERTMRLLWQVKEGWVDHEEVIDKLVDHPDIQLGYIERTMGRGGDQSKKLLLRHLEIVLREHGDQVEGFIEKIEYPLEEAFRMCEEQGNRMGKACILIKSGRNMEGVTIISEIFLEGVKEYLPVLRKQGEVEQGRRERILAQLGVVLLTCHKEWLVDNDRGEDIWEKNTEAMFRKLAVNNVDTPHVPEVIRQFLNQVITRVLEAMLEEVSTAFFLNRFVKTFSSLPQRLFMQAYRIIHNRLEFTFTLEKLNKDLLEGEEVSLWRQLMQTIYRSHVCGQSCHSCGHAVTQNEKMVSFSCQHVLHEQCYYEQDIKKYGNELCPLCYSPLESYLLCGEHKPLRYRVEPEQDQLLRAKMGKMRYYDRTTQLTAMEHWAKFEEWVDL